MDCKILDLTHSFWFQWSNSRLAWFLICCLRWWSKKAWMWWELLSSHAEWHQSNVWQEGMLKMGIGLKINHCSSCIFCNQMAVICILLLSLISFHGMNRKDFDSLEIEANGLDVPRAMSHHLHFPRWYSVRKLMDIVNREALDQLEPWQNLSVFHLGYEAGYIPRNE